MMNVPEERVNSRSPFGKTYTLLLSPRLLRRIQNGSIAGSFHHTFVWSPSLPEGGKGFVQISMFLQRISFVSVILHIKKEYFI